MKIPDEQDGTRRRERGNDPAPAADGSDAPVVLVVGGSGYFGTLLIRELLELTHTGQSFGFESEEVPFKIKKEMYNV